MSEFSACDVVVGSYGTRICVTITDCKTGAVVDMSLATDMFLVLKHASKDLEIAAALLTDGLDGKIFATTAEGDISLPGEWTVRARFGHVSWNGHTSKVSFQAEKL